MTFQDYANPGENDPLPRFSLLFGRTKKNAADQPRSGRNVAKDNALPAVVLAIDNGEREWGRDGYMKRVRVNRTCCFPFASKKSSRMNGIISPRGNCEESLIEIHYSSVYFGRIGGYPSEREEEGGFSRAASRCRWQIVFASSLKPFTERYNSRSIFDLSSKSWVTSREMIGMGSFISHWWTKNCSLDGSFLPGDDNEIQRKIL